MHITLDGYGGNPQRLADEVLIYDILDRYPEQIQMTKIAPPYVCRYVGPKPEDWGISGFVIIAESHISIHTFPDRGLLWVDIFSCKAFDADAAVTFIGEQFNLERLDVRTLERGLEYPHVVAAAIPYVERERTALLQASRSNPYRE